MIHLVTEEFGLFPFLIVLNGCDTFTSAEYLRTSTLCRTLCRTLYVLSLGYNGTIAQKYLSIRRTV